MPPTKASNSEKKSKWSFDALGMQGGADVPCDSHSPAKSSTSSRARGRKKLSPFNSEYSSHVHSNFDRGSSNSLAAEFMQEKLAELKVELPNMSHQDR